jgi:hypothetical protein
MNALEGWVLRVADSDLTWFGFTWLRPAKHFRIGCSHILLCSLLFGLPGIAVGAALIYVVLGTVEAKVWLGMFVLVMLFELPLHLLFARFWNRRAESLARSSSLARGTPEHD